jgi:tRNA-specific 2-thiouridylase
VDPLDISPLADHLAAPRGRGRLAGAPHTASAGGAICGDLVKLSVRVEADRVADAGFEAHGCAAARAAGSAAVELVRGALLTDALRVTPAALSEALGGLSPERMHAAELAADALHGALGAAARDGAPQLEPSPNRTLVAMSGGVDSAVAAWLALDRGDEVIAVTLELWSDPGTDGTKSCCSPQAATGARALAHRMGIPHVTLDVREGFRRQVVDDFVTEQAAGRTPNPCVRCNGLVRFDAMLALAERLGAARLATGHYARIAPGPLVRVAADDAKDQAYMLARLRPDELERLWFPLGALTKPAVRAIARDAGLPVADKVESQDLCFLAGTRADEFLSRHGQGRVPEGGGRIVDMAGKVLGEHAGQHRFTVGQRRGIGIAARDPLYVVDKDPTTGTVTVGPREALATTAVSVADAMLLRDGDQVDRVKLRYRSAPVRCRVAVEIGAGAHGSLALELLEPVLGVAPGQTACLMRGDCVIGWGTIARRRADPVPLPIAPMELTYAR